jgi:hypothetical protein
VRFLRKFTEAVYIISYKDCWQSLLQIYNTASIIFREKSKISSGINSSRVYKLYKRHDYPMKSDVTNVQYYKIIYIYPDIESNSAWS